MACRAEAALPLALARTAAIAEVGLTLTTEFGATATGATAAVFSGTDGNLGLGGGAGGSGNRAMDRPADEVGVGNTDAGFVGTEASMREAAVTSRSARTERGDRREGPDTGAVSSEEDPAVAGAAVSPEDEDDIDDDE